MPHLVPKREEQAATYGAGRIRARLTRLAAQEPHEVRKRRRCDEGE